MKVHVLQHVPFEGVGSMAAWLKARGAEVGCTRFFENPTLPELSGIDLVIAMGGPMSANDESILPWLRPEKQFLRNAVDRGISVLGVCLGAQLVASALGARVYRNPRKEIGWFPIETTPSATNVFRFPVKCNVFHWHGETFDLPSGAVRLAKSPACENQAFQLKRHVIGLQFHLETTPESVRSLLDHCGADLMPGPYIQTESELRKAPGSAYAEINGLMDEVLSYVTRSPA
ncbi:MAG: type 1 glutamine amidotransferase [Deltaproteobacteria bacterium]|nr:type 1 glutamine amidotransferase [Deltaproteobacteria bacterium]